MNRGARKKQGPTRIPPGVVKPGTLSRRPRRSIRSVALPIAGVAVVILGALAIVGALGSSDNGGTKNGHGGNGKKATPATTTSESPAGVAGRQTTTTPSSGASVELRATDAVWVCLIDDTGNKLVNSETLSTGEKRGPFNAGGFEVTFGNGSVEMTVNGQPEPIPAAAQPIGYRITGTEVKKLSPSAQPSCL
jgi:hypothetical protein